MLIGKCVLDFVNFNFIIDYLNNTPTCYFVVDEVSGRKYFKFRKINRKIKKEVFGGLVFKNCKINNVWEYKLFYDILNQNYGHPYLNKQFVAISQRIIKNMQNEYKENSNIKLIELLKTNDLHTLRKYW